jgi:hypothetical protein
MTTLRTVEMAKAKKRKSINIDEISTAVAPTMCANRCILRQHGNWRHVLQVLPMMSKRRRKMFSIRTMAMSP